MRLYCCIHHTNADMHMPLLYCPTCSSQLDTATAVAGLELLLYAPAAAVPAAAAVPEAGLLLLAPAPLAGRGGAAAPAALEAALLRLLPLLLFTTTGWKGQGF